eukprot:12398773-Karenia_brevis.AAC.1
MENSQKNHLDARFRRAGVGATWAQAHPYNISVPLQGWSQTNNRAELQAIVEVLRIESQPVEL